MQIEVRAGDLEKPLKVLKGIVSEAIIQFTENGVVIEVADPAGVMMLDFEIGEEFFETYDIQFDQHEPYQNDDALYVGAHVGNMWELIGAFDTDDVVSIDIDGTELVYENADSRLGQPILDLNVDDYMVDVSGIELEAYADIEAETFMQQVGKVEMLEEPIEIVFSEEEITLEADGNVASAKSRLSSDNYKGDSPVTSLYDERRVKTIKNAIKKLYSRDSLVEFGIGENMPLEVSFAEENLDISVMLAPRIKE